VKIQKITFQMRNDFSAIMVCEHCGSTQELNSGYHDDFYHNHVIPEITCRSCGKNRSGVVPAVANNNGLKHVDAKVEAGTMAPCMSCGHCCPRAGRA